ncbi:MAG: universal stress protein [Proteobacteria bacterium]|nr:universal stress protein [Pseudomonadota bacterium]MCG2743902.1 universal stress protein [Desulfobacteraceae bacterium]MBU3984087.1 universal stress protein [Pseudomonadota bacterium]MBU4027621.1 universal stress protein [Pseudomonadota bacterium]MBU4042367.1 universal stress protein [Pseudomonadota bacterium]
MYKTILVPLDGSKRAEAILSHVEEMANKLGARIILLTSIEEKLVNPGAMATSVIGYKDDDMVEQTKIAKSYLQEVQTKLEQQGLKVSTTIIQGPPVEAILTVATQENADLIAVASHGRSGLGRVFYGSVAAGIMQRVDRPLLLIRAQEG